MGAQPERVLVSRDGSVRQYVGHSNRTGTLYGRAERHGRGWVSVCSVCRATFGASTRFDVASGLRDHWELADASLAKTHQYVTAR